MWRDKIKDSSIGSRPLEFSENLMLRLYSERRRIMMIFESKSEFKSFGITDPGIPDQENSWFYFCKIKNSLKLWLLLCSLPGETLAHFSAFRAYRQLISSPCTRLGAAVSPLVRRTKSPPLTLCPRAASVRSILLDIRFKSKHWNRREVKILSIGRYILLSLLYTSSFLDIDVLGALERMKDLSPGTFFHLGAFFVRHEKFKVRLTTSVPRFERCALGLIF